MRLEGENEKENEICEMKTQLGLTSFCCGFQLALKAMEDSRGVFQCFVSDLLVVLYNYIFRDEFRTGAKGGH